MKTNKIELEKIFSYVQSLYYHWVWMAFYTHKYNLAGSFSLWFMPFDLTYLPIQCYVAIQYLAFYVLFDCHSKPTTLKCKYRLGCLRLHKYLLILVNIDWLVLNLFLFICSSVLIYFYSECSHF